MNFRPFERGSPRIRVTSQFGRLPRCTGVAGLALVQEGTGHDGRVDEPLGARIWQVSILLIADLAQEGRVDVLLLPIFWPSQLKPVANPAFDGNKKIPLRMLGKKCITLALVEGPA